MRNATNPTHAAAEAVARRSYGKLVAFLAARTRDVAGAEDALSDAFAAALIDWQQNGIPKNPEAWLITVARRKAIDAARKKRSADQSSDHLVLLAEELVDLAGSEPGTKSIPDERLSLMFACAHPAIDSGLRAPLMLQTILGFDAATIASAFLVSPSTMGQRLVRAKAKIKQAGIPFRIPEREELVSRLDAVLEAIYAVFAEGWSDPAGTETRQRNLAEEGVLLAQLVTMLLPDEPEAFGLMALILYAAARRATRRNAQGDYVPLARQNPASWDHDMIERAEAALSRASEMGRIGRYQLEAAIQSAHVVRRRTGRSDWDAIDRLYQALASLTDSPVVVINRAVVVAETCGAPAGLELLETASSDARLTTYQPYWAARAELLAQIGSLDAAKEAYACAIGLESDPAVRQFLQQRCASLGRESSTLARHTTMTRSR